MALTSLSMTVFPLEPPASRGGPARELPVGFLGELPSGFFTGFASLTEAFGGG